MIKAQTIFNLHDSNNTARKWRKLKLLKIQGEIIERGRICKEISITSLLKKRPVEIRNVLKTQIL